MELTFFKNRSNGESFVIQVPKSLVNKQDDFARADEHGISSVKLIGQNVTLSTASGQITHKDTTVYIDRKEYKATEFTVRPENADKTNMTDGEVMELIINGDEHLADVTVKLIDKSPV